jgi:hypothetical protein
LVPTRSNSTGTTLTRPARTTVRAPRIPPLVVHTPTSVSNSVLTVAALTASPMITPPMVHRVTLRHPVTLRKPLVALNRSRSGGRGTLLLLLHHPRRYVPSHIVRFTNALCSAKDFSITPRSVSGKYDCASAQPLNQTWRNPPGYHGTSHPTHHTAIIESHRPATTTATDSRLAKESNGEYSLPTSEHLN